MNGGLYSCRMRPNGRSGPIRDPIGRAWPRLQRGYSPPMPRPRIARIAALALYYGFAIKLPGRGPLSAPAQAIRLRLCRVFLEACGESVSIGPDVHLGDGRDIRIGSRSGLGRGCRVYGGLTVGEQVMVGPEVAFLASNHRFDRVDVPIGRAGLRAARAAAHRGRRLDRVARDDPSRPGDRPRGGGRRRRGGHTGRRAVRDRGGQPGRADRDPHRDEPGRRCEPRRVRP